MTTSNPDRWSKEKCVQLIRAYRAESLLWDMSNPLHYNNEKKKAAWDKIGKNLNVSQEICRRKISVVLSSFRREKAKLLDSIAGEHNPKKVYTSKWFAFEEMSFLLDKESERRRHRAGNTLGIKESAQDIKNYIEKYKGHSLTQIRSKLRHTEKSYNKQFDGASTSSNEATFLQDDEFVAFKPKRVNRAYPDEIKSYISFIMTKLKTYTPATKNQVQKAICEVLFEADLKTEGENNDATTTPGMDGDFDTLVIKEEDESADEY